MLIKGIAVSPGLAIAKCLMVHDVKLPCENMCTLTEDEVPNELLRLKCAIEQASNQLTRIQNNAKAKNDTEGAEIIDAHLMMISDPALISCFENKICELKQDAVSAAISAIEDQAMLFESLDDAYFRERAQDVRDIGRRIVCTLSGVEEQDLSTLCEDVILVGHNITPSMMASADKAHVKGIVSEIGGKTSHTAILAKNLDIPAVFGCPDIEKTITDGLLIALNGTEGTILTELSPQKEQELRAQLEKMIAVRLALRDMISAPSKTKDGVSVEIAANIMNPDDAQRVNEYGADGVGLYRTEFLYMDRNSAPSEDEQFKAYQKVLSVVKDKPVIIRTMDIGGDKEVPYLNLPKEENPFIGYRAIRICLDDRALFKTQLRAILRASVYGKGRIMFPMISSVDEFRAAKSIVHECMKELDTENKPYDKNIEIGVMIEIPSAAVMADLLISEADFMSIGTNDLTQYTLAVDRMNERLSDLYNSYHPGVIRLIKNVVDAAHRAGLPKFSGMCGEMAGDPFATILLLGLGLQEFSVNPSSVMKIRKIISLITMEEAKNIADRAFKFSTASEVENYMKEITLKYAQAWV